MVLRNPIAAMVLLIGCAPHALPRAEAPELPSAPVAVAPVRRTVDREEYLLLDPTAERAAASGYFPNWYAAARGSMADVLLDYLRAAGEPALLVAPPNEVHVRVTISPSFTRSMVIHVRGIASGATLVATLFEVGTYPSKEIRKHRLPDGDARRRWLEPADWWHLLEIVRETNVDSLPPTLSFDTMMRMTDGVVVFVELAERGRYSVVTLYGTDAVDPLIGALTALAGSEFLLPLMP